MEYILNFLRGLVPTDLEVQVGALGAMLGTVVTTAMGWNDVLEILIYIMVLDYMTGVFAAYLSSEPVVNSKRGFMGILKKVFILCIVSLGNLLDALTGQCVIQRMVILFFISNEGLSIIENAAKSGIPIPSKLKDSLEQLSDEKDLRHSH